MKHEMNIMVMYPEARREAFEKELGLPVKIESGDTKLTWNSENQHEVEVARAAFQKLRDKGFAAFSVDKKGDTKDKITSFDPDMEKMILVPPLRGGA